MKITKKILKITNKSDKIFCNKCGNEIIKNNDGYFHDYLEIKKTWGYHSDYDNETHTFDICQSCYNDFIDSFAIPIDKQQY